MTPRSGKSFSRRIHWVTLLLLLVSVAFRLFVFFRRPSLWFDEIALALNIAGRGYAGLSKPLWIQQTAPLLYLWIEHAFAAIGGVNEYALRALSLLAGVGVLWGLRRFALQTFGERVALVCVALAGFTYYLARYANEVKPYELDAFVTVALLLLASHCLRGEKWTGREAVLLLVAGCVAPWLSAPSMFVLAGAGTALLIERWRSNIAVLAGVGAAWVVSSALAYGMIYRPVATSWYMKLYWSGLRIDSSWPLARVGRTVVQAIVEPAIGLSDTPSSIVSVEGVLLSALGLWFVFRQKRKGLVALLVMPYLCCFAAAVAGLWVLSPRLVLFAAPITICLMALGVEQLSLYAPARWRNAAFWVIAGAALLLPVRFWTWEIRHPEFEADRELVEAASRSVRPGDAVYVYARAMAPWVFYRQQWRVGDAEFNSVVERMVEPLGPNSGNLPPRDRPVSNEGASLRFERDGHAELPGISSGAFSGYSPRESAVPDAGWAENEAARIRSAGARRVVVVAGVYKVKPIRALLERLNGEGYGCRKVFEGRLALLFEMTRGAGGASLAVCKVE